MSLLSFLDWFSACSTFLAATATTMVAYLTKKTLKEIKEQKESSYIPYIYISDQLSIHFNANFFDKNTEELVNSFNNNSFIIYNMGKGLAHHIIIQFDLDLEKYANKALELYEKNNIESNSLNYFINLINKFGKEPIVYPIKLFLEEKQNVTIKIPDIFLYILSVDSFFKEYKNVSLGNLEMNITISYKDLLNKEGKSYFKWNSFSWQYNEKKNSEKYLDVTYSPNIIECNKDFISLY